MLRRMRAAAMLRLRRFALLLFRILPCTLLCATFLVPAVHAQTADLHLTQTASATAVAAGATYTYTEVVKNNTSERHCSNCKRSSSICKPHPIRSIEAYTGTNWTCTNPGAGATSVPSSALSTPR